jgi:hypothetical protein
VPAMRFVAGAFPRIHAVRRPGLIGCRVSRLACDDRSVHNAIGVGAGLQPVCLGDLHERPWRPHPHDALVHWSSTADLPASAPNGLPIWRGQGGSARWASVTTMPKERHRRCQRLQGASHDRSRPECDGEQRWGFGSGVHFCVEVK